MARDVEHNRYHQGFEDFLNNEAERAIAEASLHQNGQRLWVLLYEDGRYELEHAEAGAPPSPHETAAGEPVIFPVEPLDDAEIDRRDPENSDFAPAIERMWRRFREAHGRATH